MDEMETANHSGYEEPQETVTETIETPTEGNDSPPQEEPRGIPIKYNGEDEVVGYDEAPTWIQKGKNYAKVSEKADKFQQSLERAARLNGYPDHESYMTALDEYEANLRIQEEADRLNVSEDFLRAEFNPIKQELSQAKTELQQLKEADMVRQVQGQIESMERNATEYPDFAKYKNDVINLAADKGYTLDDAYIITSHRDQVNSARMQAQQETIRNLQQNADSSTGSLGADSPEHASGFLAMSPAERKAFRDQNRSRA